MYHKNCITVLSLLLVVLGALLIALKSNFYNYGMHTLLTFEPGSQLFNAWVKSPPGVNFDVYVFNWTNPEDFKNLSTKPILKEVGPFRFRQVIEKVNATMHGNETMSYYRRRTFYFNRDESVHDLDFNLTIPNPVAMALAHRARNWNFFSKKGVYLALSSLIDDNLHITKPAGELIFTGYEDPILSAADKFSFFTDAPPSKNFAFFYGKNGSATFDGIFNVGIGGDHPLGQIFEWNYQNDTDYYEESCSKFEGSAGDFFPRFNTDKTLKLFHSDVCRTLVADYEGNTTVHGIEGLKYVMGDHFLDNGTLIPGNECTCGEHCLPYGVVYATACKQKSPNYLSLPHFYKADPYFVDKLIGVKPDPDRHDFHLIYEPTTGLPLELLPRLQINVLMQPISYINMYEDIPTVLFPLIWFEQTLGMPSSSAFLVKIILNMNDICLTVGILLITLGILIFLFLAYKIRNTDFCPNDHHKNFLPKELVPLKEKETPT
ncbi:protein croquemort-like [Coccinella septempunctata]|uniref:protein croquemort-like n=1 Tax=Coccinella septempunctata TaxID=41139 RepID=UPI001D07B7B4|nr:protein croquemort-like [Coccinella septempunctata]XP_044753955.1 protein croquemort-like [Coccinella septempunctata]XP_044753956.1 protein croquemort-like [Coccinella septempunctata]XP_044753957.1 protein croquemort-like [Coccinella septempunctata]XP_044753958.1 protein croquemort-like [Coccinella septempunctata]